MHHYVGAEQLDTRSLSLNDSFTLLIYTYIQLISIFVNQLSSKFADKSFGISHVKFGPIDIFNQTFLYLLPKPSSTAHYAKCNSDVLCCWETTSVSSSNQMTTNLPSCQLNQS